MGKHDILYLTPEQVVSLGVYDMKAALEDVEKTFSLVDNKDALTPHKIAMEWPAEIYGPQNRINCMPGFLGGDIQMAGVKWIGSSLNNSKYGLPRASAIIILNDPDTKLPVCILDGTAISAMRTGANGGTAVKYLAKKDAKSLLILGCGVQARTQLSAAVNARPEINEIYVYDLFFDKAKQFAVDMGEKLNVSITPVTSPAEICHKVDVLISVTVADKPVVHSDWVHPGLTYIHMGGPECTFNTIRKADKRIFDDWACMLSRGGTSAALMYDAGLLKDEDVYSSLGAVVNSKVPGRESNDEFVFYGSCGMGVTDIAIAARLYKTAMKKGIGTFLPYV